MPVTAFFRGFLSDFNFVSMAITLSWDLFIIVFFIVIIAYSFIIGKNQTLKVIIGSYIAVLTADGFGNLVEQFLLAKTDKLTFLPSSSPLVILKITVFILGIVLLAIRGGFEVNVPEDQTPFMGILTTFCFGFLNAGLIVSTILVYVSGFSFVEGSTDLSLSPIFELYTSSSMVQIMINNYNLWFSLPAIGFVFLSMVYKSK